ncbi:hypothetical protein [Denitromonas ohlonensis]|uniref:Uncharacterized protein n=2 Tax=Denitromonas TaxID=139331 RepID=A0A557RV39_9RHOO|nr:hypothetical protein [Denitromonas ohlonensis]TVO69023.1 hypothetical protein FHP90_00010 [Denitromonas ohlonensis]TVO77123.1 hypothetical protein FHP89_07240 [Denitromonas ohlonensis]
MKSAQVIALSLGLMLSAPVMAHGGPYMGGALAAVDPAQAVEKLKENATRLQAQVARIAEAANDEARGKAVAEYMHSLGEGMVLARALDPHGVNCPMGWGGMGMMGPGMMGPGMMGYGAASGDDPAVRLQAIEARLQMMMQHMMGGQPVPPAK